MTKIAAALINYAEVYRSFVMSKEVKPYNVEVEIQYATQDIFNSVKHLTEEMAIATINDDALYIQEKMAKKVAA